MVFRFEDWENAALVTFRYGHGSSARLSVHSSFASQSKDSVNAS
jgi:hypothetical protein